MRYPDPGSGRDLRLDLLRGLCVALMVLAHLWPSPLHDLMRLRPYWTAAEGFFLLSGAVLGIVYRRRLEGSSLMEAAGRLGWRAVELWMANLAVAVLWLARDLWRLSPEALERVWGDPWWSRLFTLDLPYFLHVLPRYTVFLLIAPGALALLRRGRTGWLAAASLAAWLAGLADWREPGLPGLEPGPTWFPVLSWQALFFAGLAMGWHRRRVAAWWRRMEGWSLALALAAVVVAFELLRLRIVAAGGWPGEAFWLGREVLGPLRWLAFGATFGLVFLVTDRLWAPIERWSGALLLELGRNALYVFLLHMLFVMALHPLPRHLPAVPPAGWLAADLAVIAMLWWMARRRLFFWLVPR